MTASSNFFPLSLKEMKILCKKYRSFSAKAVLKRDMIKELEEKKERIRELRFECSVLEDTLCHYTDERDKKFILRHWQKLLHLYTKYHPKLFEHIVVSCFELYEWSCKWGCARGKRSILLSDLLEMWAKGFRYREMPVVCVRNMLSYHQGTTERQLVCITRDGKLTTVCPNDEPRGDMPAYEDFVRNLPKCPAWSNISVSDFKFTEDKKIEEGE